MTTLPEPLNEAANKLEQLIKMLFPDPHPELFTLDNYRYRYQLRDGLVETAVQSIEQSQRINRQRGDYKQAGLCEFHIGLIYLHVGDYRGARQQFEQARKQWSFVYEPAAVPLAYLAEGIVQQLAFHQEAAMRCYTQASKRLPRIKFVPPTQFNEKFFDELTIQLQAVQDVAHKKLWPVQNKPEQEESQITVTEDETIPTVEESLPQAQGEGEKVEETAVSADSVQAVSRPTNDRPETVTKTNPPIINYQTNTTPIPEHQYLGTQYEWYRIEKQPTSNFFPSDVQKGAWILVDKSPNWSLEELVLVIAEEQDTRNGRIIVTPVRQERPFPRIYLAWLKNINRLTTEQETEPAKKIESVNIVYDPDIDPLLIKIQEIIGVIVGVWLPVQIR